MLKKIINKLALSATLLTSLLMPLAPATVMAQGRDDICAGIELTGGSCTNTEANENRVQSVVETIINILSLIVGIVAVIMIIIGGLKYITSSGDSNNVSSAKNTILYAVIGLVVVALAQIIVRFVLDTVVPS